MRSKQPFYILIIALNLLFLLSCETPHAFYTLNQQDVNFFKEKNEVNISGGFNKGEFSKGWELKGAFSIPWNIAFSGGISKVKSYNGWDNSDYNEWKCLMTTGAIGYYKPIKKGFVTEGYLGTTFSSQKHVFAIENYNIVTGDLIDVQPSYSKKGSADMRSSSVYFQQSIGYTSKNFDAAFSLNYTYLYFKNVNNNISDPSYSFYTTIQRMSEDKAYSIINPSIFLRGGSDLFKLYAKIDFTLPVSSMNFPYNNYCFSLGMCLSLTHRYD